MIFFSFWEKNLPLIDFSGHVDFLIVNCIIIHGISLQQEKPSAKESLPQCDQSFQYETKILEIAFLFLPSVKMICKFIFKVMDRLKSILVHNVLHAS